jgi:cellulose synthase/poly-beta-1,6-N-acetylglucosamine synthase-like glycosyltransferase
MEVLFIICVVVLGTYLLIQLLVIVGLQVKQQVPPVAPADVPTVSILIAARNEAQNLPRCLDAIAQLKYPIEKLEVWIGNDQSTDQTGAIAAQYEAKFSHMHAVDITHEVGKAKGKANVLAQLARKSSGSYLFITDADVAVNPFWIQSLLMHGGEKVGIVSGFTVIEANNFFARMQQIDWLYFMGILLGLHRMGLMATAVGNNMAVRRDAYESTGGYEQIDPSITEDFKLYLEVVARGYQSRNVLHSGSINTTLAVDNFDILLNQRKRWLHGARELPLYWWLIFAVFGLFLPCWIVVFLMNPAVAFYMFIIRVALQSHTIHWLAGATQSTVRSLHLVWYECYLHFITLCSGIYFLLPIKIKWKNRIYPHSR